MTMLSALAVLCMTVHYSPLHEVNLLTHQAILDQVVFRRFLPEIAPFVESFQRR